MQLESNTYGKALFHSILWGFLLPQAILVLLNLYSWDLIKGEANQEEARLAAFMLTSELMLIIVSLSVLFIQKTKNITINWKILLISLVAHAAYMWFFVTSLHGIIPNSIQPWIVSIGNVGRWNITLLMPGAFLSLYGLTKVGFSSVKESTSRSIVLGVGLGVPALWYMFVSLMQPAWFGQLNIVISIVVSSVAVTVFLAAFIRMFDNLINRDSTGRFAEKHYLLATLLGLAAPLGGLKLNETIPFPTDFQATTIYALTAINGLVLLIKPNQTMLSPVILFLRFSTLPFAAYFFMVFLPFLPLSLLAIIIMGAGFLMLTPLAMGLFQARITYIEFINTKAKIGHPKAAFIAVLGFSLLPSYLIAQAFLDKQALEVSLNYFYSHDTSKKTMPIGQIDRASKALVQLRDRKSDIQMPYISGIYNNIVFGNLVLPDSKIIEMYRLLNNEVLPDTQHPMFGARGLAGRSFQRGTTVPPKRDVDIKSYQLNDKGEYGKTLSMVLQNNTDDTHSLFVDNITIPEGVFVTGLRLKIENEWEDGRIFDRKTALWVFQKITEVRRDPAILYYLSPQLLELRVYPFPKIGVREVEVDFDFHPAVDSQISVGGKNIDLNPDQNMPSIVLNDGRTIDAQDISTKVFKREPYLHFILDSSKGTTLSTEDYMNKIRSIAKKIGISSGKITAANIGVSNPHIGDVINFENEALVKKRINEIEIERVGGLWVQQALAKEIINVQNGLNKNNVNQVPIFIIVSSKSLAEHTLKLNKWNWLAPDMSSWYYSSPDKLEEFKIQNEDTNVMAVKNGNNISILPANDSAILESNGNDVQIYSISEERFTPLAIQTSTINQKSAWTKYAQIWIDWKQTSLNPFSIEEKRKYFHDLSREYSLLLPETSFIVVESESQWEILKRKEKQSLNNHSGLEFDNEEQTSEPPWWLMLTGLLIYLFIKQRKQQLSHI